MFIKQKKSKKLDIIKSSGRFYDLSKIKLFSTSLFTGRKVFILSLKFCPVKIYKLWEREFKKLLLNKILTTSYSIGRAEDYFVRSNGKKPTINPSPI